MADIFSNAQAKRLFGMIAAGSTTGALVGPALTATLVLPLGPTNLLLLSAAFMGWEVLCIHRLVAWQRSLLSIYFKDDITDDTVTGLPDDTPMGGGVPAGVRLIFQSPYLIGICLLMLLFTKPATFLYFQQA